MKKLMMAVCTVFTLLGSTVCAQESKPVPTVEELTAKFKADLVNKEAPDFKLLDMDGKEVSLRSLKGKVVVLDFWATWCKPCVGSFPGMQAVVDKYKDDQDVAFLFIDCWEQNENYKEEVKTFITDNKYTFHVLFDDMKSKENAVTTAYGVQGIPCKVIIDKLGNIRLQSMGSGRDVDYIVNEMTAKIELVKSL